MENKILPSVGFKASPAQRKLKKWLGLGLIIASFAFYGGLMLVPLTPFSTTSRILLSISLIVCGEASFWLAVLILGKQTISRYRNFDPRNWASKLAKAFKIERK